MRKIICRKMAEHSAGLRPNGPSRFSNQFHCVYCFNRPGLRSVMRQHCFYSPTSIREYSVTSQLVTGPFDIQLEPQPLSTIAAHSGLGRLSLSKVFHGNLEATSTGEMISFRSPIAGSAGYVAMETVHGTLNDRKGSFVLQHCSTLSRGTPAQSITVVPDSGTDELAGLNGSMTIEITTAGAHSYRFEFSLPDVDV